MKFFITVAYLCGAIFLANAHVGNAQGQLVKVELFHDKASGHARSDPIINQQCASGHVHTFYGPKDFHPNTRYEDLLNAPPQLSTSRFEENQSLYWHPTFYEVTQNGWVYTRVSHTQATAYYRWDNSILPRTEEFPPGFRMISASNDPGSNIGGPTGGNLFSECCNQMEDRLDCFSFDGGDGIVFPEEECDFLDVAFAMPTCWDGKELGDKNNHKDHMRFTLDGTVWGECPSEFNHRLPQIQLFVKIREFNGIDRKYQLSDGSSHFHIDFFNGWKERKLQEMIDDCEVIDPEQPIGEVNPQTGCTPEVGDFRFLTESDYAKGSVCDKDVRRLIIDENTDVTTSLPNGSCTGQLISKSWDQLNSNLFEGACDFSEVTDDMPCVEKKGGRFLLGYKRDDDGNIIKTLKKKCKWLKKQKDKKKRKWKKICKRKNGNKDYDPANIVCPITCETKITCE